VGGGGWCGGGLGVVGGWGGGWVWFLGCCVGGFGVGVGGFGLVLDGRLPLRGSGRWSIFNKDVQSLLPPQLF